MTVSLNPSTLIQFSLLPIKHLMQENYPLAELFQRVFEVTYLTPFDRDPKLVLKEKEFEVLDEKICRVTHGAMHAARVAAFVKVLHLFRLHSIPQQSLILDPLQRVTRLELTQLLHLTQIVGCLHDAARRAEVADRWDKESAALCFLALRQLFEDQDEALLSSFSKMIEFKDDTLGYVSFLQQLGFKDDVIAGWNYLRELIHDADCLDIMRVRKTFDLKYLDVVKHIQHPAQVRAFLQLVIEARDLIHHQSDMFKDVTIVHPFEASPIPTLQKQFCCAKKSAYEHAPLMYAKILEDMSEFPWLKTITEPASYPKSIASLDVVFPEKTLRALSKDLACFSQGDCTIYHGGPVDGLSGTRWLMPISFKDDLGKIRAAYELCFINCHPFEGSCEDASFHFFSITDLDLKIRDISNSQVQDFFDLINSQDTTRKAIVLRHVDLANICYPEIFNAYLYEDTRPKDLGHIIHFLKERCSFAVDPKAPAPSAAFGQPKTSLDGIIARKKISLELDGSIHEFFVEHQVNPEDPWASYYLFRLSQSSSVDCQETTVRIDSGCTSGMVYCDQRCTCQKELEQGLLSLTCDAASNSVLIHIPAHDGRGMGMAPKAETEIYKRGGQGKLCATPSLSDKEAAQQLYQTEHIDIRTYDGAAALLKQQGIHSIKLISRSSAKRQALEKAGIRVQDF